MQVLFTVFMFIIGAVFGSFLCCQARRLRLADGRRRGPQKNFFHQGVSVCLHCHKKLKWHDNIPLFSWLFLRGRCRHCGKNIGAAEFISEVATAAAFTLLATTINVNAADAYAWAEFALVAVFTLLIIFVAIYDGLYGEMPTIFLTISIICAIIILILRVGHSFLVAGFFDAATVEILKSSLIAALYGGIYLILYLISRGAWVGDGDWLLGLAIGLALGSPWLAAVSLFAANLSACIVMLPFLLIDNSKKGKQNPRQGAKNPARTPRQIYFGPFMAFAFVIIYVFADKINSLML